MTEKAIPRLVIHPKQATDCPHDVQIVIDTLANIGLLGAPEEDQNTFLAGEQFLELITFLGCSPSVNLNPSESEHYCNLNFNAVTDSIRCLGYTELIKPQCPVCKQTISHWRESPIWFDGSANKACEHCGAEKPVASFRWRKEAGFGRFSFHINHIHPHEVVPADSIFQALEQATGFAWAYFYANNQEQA